jgi:hypothetical protein
MNVQIMSAYRRHSDGVKEVRFEDGTGSLGSGIDYCAHFTAENVLIDIRNSSDKALRKDLAEYLVKRYRAKFDEALAGVPNRCDNWQSPRMKAIDKAFREFMGLPPR